MNTITLKSVTVEKIDDTDVIKAIIYSDEIDRDGEQATEKFLESFSKLIIGRPVARDHDWMDVDKCVGSVVDAEVTEIEGQKCVVITLAIKDEDALTKIKDGRYNTMSAGFEAEKSEPDENGIVHLLDCLDAFEVSFVLVPAVPSARVIQKSYRLGGKSMNKFSLKRLFDKHPELKGLDPEVIDDIKAAETEEIKAEDVEALIEENEKLSKENEELRAEVKTLKEAEEVKKSEEGLAQAIAEALEGATVSDKTKEYIDSEVKAGCTDVIEEDAIKEVVSTVVEKYKDLGLVEWAEQEVEEPEHTDEEQEVKEEEVKEVEDSSTVDIDETLNEEEDKKVKAKKSYNDISNIIIEEKGKVTKKSYNNNYNHTLSNGCFIE